MDHSQPIPPFSNEAEEAQWWYEQRDQLTAQAETALAHGELKLHHLDPSLSVVCQRREESDYD